MSLAAPAGRGEPGHRRANGSGPREAVTVNLVCTVLLRLSPGSAWPLLLAAVRDEILNRPWEPPAAHWPSMPTIQGGRDLTSGGTWLGVDHARGVVAAVLNGVRRPEPPPGQTRPTRGSLPLAALEEAAPVEPANVRQYDGFHLLRADRDFVEVWSWDGDKLTHQWLGDGDHIIVNLGPDRDDDPLVPHFMPLLRALPEPDPRPGLATAEAWGEWLDLLRGDGLAPADPRGLLIEHDLDGAPYGSSSACLVAIGADGAIRFDFTPTPRKPQWSEIARPRRGQMSD